MESPALDIAAIILYGLVLLAYAVFLLIRMRRNPAFSIHSVNQKVRLLWVQNVMQHPDKDVMAVQTLRNLEMAATFKASSAILLIIGTLTLSGQADNLAKTWHVLDLNGSTAPGLWTLKILCLLTVLIVAFFAFSMTIRVLNHVVFMVNLPMEEAAGTVTPEQIAQRLNRAAAFYSVGVRAFFVAVPLVFWLFGAIFLVAATVGVVSLLYCLDRNPINNYD